MLRTSEFLPYVVFLQSPDFEVLKAMNHSAVEAGVVTKTLTVRNIYTYVDKTKNIFSSGSSVELTIHLK